MEHIYQNIIGWFNYQNLYTDMVKKIPDNSHIVEIGAWKGASTAYLAVEIINSGKNIKLDVVDTWKGSDNDPAQFNYDPDIKANNGNIFNIFEKNIKPVRHVINPIQLSSVEAAKLYDDKSLDFVFIDGNHGYDAVINDIMAWLPKIKNGGWIGGHDYNHPSLPGVTQAVQDCLGFKVQAIPGNFDPKNPNNQQIGFNNDSWLIQLDNIYNTIISNNKKATLCITSFDRFDLLQQTIDSFINLNAHPSLIERIIITEDSTKLEMKEKILKKYGSIVELIFNDKRIGQSFSIDKMYKTVTSEYIFHSEDDYLYVGNPNFVKESIDLLEEKQDIHQVWVRHLNNFYVSHGNDGNSQFENEILQLQNGIKYKMLKQSHCRGWCGFSWNPGLRRTIDYRNMFPNGYSTFADPNHMISGVETEFYCNSSAKRQGYRAALLINGACNNMGVGRATYK